ncbi:MAG: hypothetical protein HZA08_07875 [Nitrospirae bacterium]|nr:hypothetical protein [Nitrospirota bacterium]
MKKIISIAMIVIITGAFLFSACSKEKAADKNLPATYVEYKNNPEWKGGEANPIVSSVYFTGVISDAYKAAAEIPDVLDHMYCYCYCAEDHGHHSLRTCFTDGHGSGCDICINEALLARKMHKEGYRIKQIRDQIDKEFYQPYQSHDHM